MNSGRANHQLLREIGEKQLEVVRHLQREAMKYPPHLQEHPAAALRDAVETLIALDRRCALESLLPGELKSLVENQAA